MDGRFIGVGYKKRFNFSQFLSFYVSSYNKSNKTNVTTSEILKKWWKYINSTDKYFGFHNNEAEFKTYMEKCIAEPRERLMICPSCGYILLWFSFGKKFDIEYPTPNFREQLLAWMK